MLEHLTPNFSQSVRTIYSIVSSYSEPDAPSLKPTCNSTEINGIQMKHPEATHSIRVDVDLNIDLQTPTSSPRSPRFHWPGDSH